MSFLRQRRFYMLAGLALGISLVMFMAQMTTGTLLANAFLIEPISIERGPLAQSESTSAPTALEDSIANCRYGIAAITDEQVDLVDDFGSGMFVDFRHDTLKYLKDNPLPNEAQYLPLVAVKENKDADGNYLGTYKSKPRIDITDANDKAGLRYWLQRYPGRLWNIGNEVERGPDPGGQPSSQGDTHAEVYAQAYKEIRDYILKYDSTARTTFTALVEVTPIRLAYLDIAWEAHIEMYGYPPEVDAWTMHLYILPEANASGTAGNNIANIPVGTEHLIDLAKKESGGDPALCVRDDVYCLAEHDDMNVFAQQVVDMRIWMKEHGQQNRPLLLTEYSLLYPYTLPGGDCLEDEFGNCFDPPRVEAFLNASLDYLDSAADPNLGYPMDDYRLIQQWVWFSINHEDKAGTVSNFYDNNPDGTLAGIWPLGQMYKDRISSIETNVNLTTDQAGTIFVKTDNSGTADVDIWATFRNNGNTHITEPFDVTFYSDPSLNNAIGTASVTPDPIVAGCAQMNYRVSTTWNDLEPGMHKYWAKIDSSDDIDETDENDNRIMGRVFVDGDLLYLPVTMRH